MIADGKSKCEQARAYYYDYLYGLNQGTTPEEIVAHINQCAFCQTEVDRLNAELGGETEKDASQTIDRKTFLVAANLKLHFAYTGVAVSCKTARPFLPSLADPAFEVGVPTPITVHLDKCPQCSDDLEKIRRLKLAHKQLCRLGQLFAEEFAVDVEFCTKAQNVIYSVGDCVFEDISVDTLRHFCLCPDCRELLYKYRESKAEKVSWSAEQSQIPCDAVSATDVFDYVVPYGFDPDKDESAMFRPSLTKHLANCPKCLGKMQELHDTVYGILHRAESDVVICFKPDQAARDSTISDPDNPYEDWPIQVEVFDKSSEDGMELVTTKTALKSKQKRLGLRIRPLIKPVAAAAAILIVALLLFRAPVAKAVDLDQIYDVLERIKNVYITTYVPEKPEPAQQIWISTELNVKMFKTGTQYVLWDLRDKIIKSRDSGTDLIKTDQLSNNASVEVERTMGAPWDLLPFNKMSAVRAVSEDVTWELVPYESIKITILGTEVYELMWTEKGLGGSTIQKKWRGYLDAETTLPKRIERWEKFPEEEVYELLTVTEVAYPTTDEVQAAIRDAGFQISSVLLRQP
jgi:hypothetical protein